MKKCLFLFLSFVLFKSVLALEPIPPSRFTLKKLKSGFQVRIEDAPSPEGGSYIQYQILDKNRDIVKSFPVSNTQFDVHGISDDVHSEKISVESCQAKAKELESEMKKLKFKGLKVNIEACKGNREKIILKN